MQPSQSASYSSVHGHGKVFSKANPISGRKVSNFSHLKGERSNYEEEAKDYTQISKDFSEEKHDMLCNSPLEL